MARWASMGSPVTSPMAQTLRGDAAMRIDRDKAPGHVQLQPFQAKALGGRRPGDQHALGRQGKFVGPGIAHMHALLRVVAGHAAAQVQHHAAARLRASARAGPVLVVAGQHALGDHLVFPAGCGRPCRSGRYSLRQPRPAALAAHRASASVDDQMAPPLLPKGMDGSEAGSEPVASSRCSQRTRTGSPPSCGVMTAVCHPQSAPNRAAPAPRPCAAAPRHRQTGGRRCHPSSARFAQCRSADWPP